MRIGVVDMPIYYGSEIYGVEKGPRNLRRAGLMKKLENIGEITDMGEVFVKICAEEERYREGKNAKYLAEVVAANERLAEKVSDTYQKNWFPLVIGGDHSLGMGSIAAAHEAFGDDLAVFWVDAHGDFNDDETSPSGNIHGMPLAASAGIGLPELVNLYVAGRKVNPENVYIIGARDIDPGEAVLLKNHGAHVYTTEDVLTRGAAEVTREALADVREKGIGNLHVSFDIDVIDPEFIPGTGTKVPGGITPEKARTILKTALDTDIIRSMDVVEYNPRLDKGDITKKHVLDFLALIVENIEKK